jgi:hypothetical protein
MTSQKWELVEKNDAKKGEKSLAVYRAKVPGGWLVQSAYHGCINGWEVDSSRPMFPLADPNHEWLARSPSRPRPKKG